MSTHNIGFNEEITKIIFHLPSNMHLRYLFFFDTDKTLLEKAFSDCKLTPILELQWQKAVS